MVDDPGHRKIHSHTIPLAGGLAVVTGLLLPLLAGWLWLSTHPESLSFPMTGGHVSTNVAPDSSFPVAVTSATAPFLLRYGFGARVMELGAILAGALGMLLVGSLDDRYELRPMIKFGGQTLIAAGVAAAGVRITLFVENTAFSYAVTILWLLTVINALNFMDNMNGLCSGLGAIAAGFFGGIAAAKGQYLVALLAFASCGAMIGFLPWNYPRAKAFLGDGGSHLVGYLLAVLAILPHFYTPETPQTFAVLTPLVVLAVPLFDMAWVVLLRWRMGQPFYQGDTNHLSHRLNRAGLSRTTAVLIIWGLAATSGALSLLLQ